MPKRGAPATTLTLGADCGCRIDGGKSSAARREWKSNTPELGVAEMGIAEPIDNALASADARSRGQVPADSTKLCQIMFENMALTTP